MSEHQLHLGAPRLAEGRRGDSPTLNFVLPPDLLETVDDQAAAAGLARSNYLRTVLGNYLASEREPLSIATARPKTRSRNVNVRIPETMMDQLMELVEETGHPKSTLTRAIVEHHLPTRGDAA